MKHLLQISIICLVICCASSLNNAQSPSPVFDYAGFNLQMDLSVLRKTFPRSSHEFSLRDGDRAVIASDDPSQVKSLFQAATGTYIIRLTADESPSDLYYVQAEIDRGILQRLRLSFEKPSELMNRHPKAEFGERHPRCEAIKTKLIRLYGKPDSTTSSWEEQLQNNTSTWLKPTEALALNCGRYYKRRKLFAMEITLDRKR